MKFAATVVSALLMADGTNAFTYPLSVTRRTRSGYSTNGVRLMALGGNMPPPSPATTEVSDLPEIQQTSYGQPMDIRYSDFLRLVNADRIEKVTFNSEGTSLIAVDVDGARCKIDLLPQDPELLTDLNNHNVDINLLPPQQSGGLGELAKSLIFPAVLFGGLFFLSRRGGGSRAGGRGARGGKGRNTRSGGTGMPGGGGGGGPFGGMGGNPMSFAKSKAKIQMVPDTGVTFDDVAGCDGAKLELVEVVDFLKKPEAYTKNGCRIPRGVILDGPPGTGKTLLAKAVAGEAGVPFISVSGSEFVEMFVGVGASRVRDIFQQARKIAPCIIFIDEIDAVGRQRGAGYAGGNDEREQTVNQILVEMDGFSGNPGIITIAATNRVDILDSALLRPGRFDRKVTVDLPDFKGRTKVLGVHARGKPLEPDVDLEAVARRTPGFSGAQLENLMNEAAIAAARRDKESIGWDEIDATVDRIMVGVEKKTGNMNQARELVAYHEAGHAVVGALVPDYDMVQKISIIPRSNGAGGLTFFAPQDSRLESGMYSRQYLESNMAVAMGGRLAEELLFGPERVTTGASNDFQQVSNIASLMVKEWGMSEKLGPIAIRRPGGDAPFMGLQFMGRQGPRWGPDVLTVANEEVERLVSNAYVTAKNVLLENRPLLDHLAKVLMDQEVVSAEEFQMMLVEFGAKTIPYKVYPDKSIREELPYQSLTGALTRN